jgi:hypothetical protein
MERFFKIYMILLFLMSTIFLSSCVWKFMVKKEKNNLDVEFFESQNEIL